MHAGWLPCRTRVVRSAAMTIELYRDDSYLKTCTAAITAVGERGLVVDRSVFYALGGGQPGDTGEIRSTTCSPVVAPTWPRQARSARCGCRRSRRRAGRIAASLSCSMTRAGRRAVCAVRDRHQAEAAAVRTPSIVRSRTAASTTVKACCTNCCDDWRRNGPARTMRGIASDDRRSSAALLHGVVRCRRDGHG